MDTKQLKWTWKWMLPLILIVIGGLGGSFLRDKLISHAAAMDDATIRRYQVADAFSWSQGYVGIIQAAPGDKVFKIKSEAVWTLNITYDATSDSTMWREGNHLHLAKGYRIGAA